LIISFLFFINVTTITIISMTRMVAIIYLIGSGIAYQTWKGRRMAVFIMPFTTSIIVVAMSFIIVM